MPEQPDSRERLKQSLRATAECLALDRLGAAHTAAERAHLQGCAHCQAELALWHEFEASAAGVEDNAAVEWIVGELQDRRGVPRVAKGARGGWFGTRGLMAAAATVLLAVTVGYLASDREPAVRDLGSLEQQEYRTAQVQVIAPLGDLAAVPRTFEWKAVAGATSYDLAIIEVDRTPVWSASSADTRLAPPPAIVSRFAPGKPFLWEVTARDRSHAAIAASGAQRFRVMPSSSGE